MRAKAFLSPSTFTGGSWTHGCPQPGGRPGRRECDRRPRRHRCSVSEDEGGSEGEQVTNRVASTTLLLPDCPRLSPHLPGKTPTRTCWRPWGLPCFLRQARGPSASSGIPCRPSRHVTVFRTTMNASARSSLHERSPSVCCIPDTCQESGTPREWFGDGLGEERPLSQATDHCTAGTSSRPDPRGLHTVSHHVGTWPRAERVPYPGRLADVF